MSGYFTFNGVSSATFGLLVSNITNFGAPARVVDKVQVPYRNGDLLLDTGTYNNYIVTYKVALINDVKADARAIAEWLLAPQGYCTLTDSYNSTETRYAAYYNQLDITMEHLNRYGSATISFDCKPQRYLQSGQSARTINTTATTLTNPTEFTAKPLIVIGGNGTVHIGSYTITVSNNAGDTITIDCESMQCYRGTTNMNGSVSLPNGFPVLTAGSNVCTRATSSCTVTPRWWRL